MTTWAPISTKHSPETPRPRLTAVHILRLSPSYRAHRSRTLNLRNFQHQQQIPPSTQKVRQNRIMPLRLQLQLFRRSSISFTNTASSVRNWARMESQRTRKSSTVKRCSSSNFTRRWITTRTSSSSRNWNRSKRSRCSNRGSSNSSYLSSNRRWPPWPISNSSWIISTSRWWMRLERISRLILVHLLQIS